MSYLTPYGPVLSIEKRIFVVSYFTMRSAIFLLAFFITGSVCAQTYHAPKSGVKYMRVKEASVRRVLPGRPEVPIRKEYKFTITWLSNEKPEIIYCYTDNSWWQCIVSRDRDAIDNMQRITKGDVLDLIPSTPATIPLKKYHPVNTTVLLFKTKKTSWLSITIKNVIHKPDLALP